MTKQEQDNLINAITLYLQSHPNAADSMEGIMQWWLPQQLGPVDISELQSVLDYLVETGAILKDVLIDGRTLYSSKGKDAIN